MARDDSDDPSAATAVVLDTIATQTGVSASLTRSDDGAELLRVRDAQGRLLFEHNSATRLTVLVAPDGDLELRAPRGKVRVVAAEGIELSTPSVRSKVGEARVEGKTLELSFERIKTAAAVVETVAGRILERARDAYRETEGLSQTRAGRLRLVAEKTISMLGQRAVVKAREDVKVKGEKVYLA